MMDDILSSYINSIAPQPPIINEQKIVMELAGRRKRLAIIMLSLAGLLWSIVLYGAAFMVCKKNQTAGITLFSVLSTGYMCAGLFAGLVVKFRKVRL